MKILYIHQYFVTPEEDGASRSYWFSRKLIENGIDVTMITATNKYMHHEPCRVNIDGIDVVYVKNDYDQSLSKIRKVKAFVSFIIKAYLAAKKQPDVDLVFATSTPLTVGFLALLLKKLKKIPYIFEVRDLWPEFPIQVGAIKNRFLIFLLRKLEKSIYNNAEHIITLSPGMTDGVIRCDIPATKISMIPNMSKIDLYYPRISGNEDFERYGIDKSKFNVVHTGSMGVANDLMYLMHAAEYLLYSLNNNTINFVIVGEGSTKKELEEYSHNKNLSNVKFLGHWGTTDNSAILNCCDISFVCFKNLPILYTNSPNKLFDSLSAGKPIVVNSAGWTKDLVEKNECGFFVLPENPKDFACKLLDISNNRELLTKYSLNSRKLAEDKYDKSILTKQFYDIISTHLQLLETKRAH